MALSYNLARQRGRRLTPQMERTLLCCLDAQRAARDAAPVPGDDVRVDDGADVSAA